MSVVFIRAKASVDFEYDRLGAEVVNKSSDLSPDSTVGVDGATFIMRVQVGHDRLGTDRDRVNDLCFVEPISKWCQPAPVTAERGPLHIPSVNLCKQLKRLSV